MDDYEYKKIMQEFYSLISKFISDNPEILHELEQKEALFSVLDIEESERKTIYFARV